MDGQDTHPTLYDFVQVALQVKKGLKDSSAGAGNGGTFLADQGEDWGGLPVEIDDTPGTTLGAYYGANSMGIKRDVKAFHMALCTVGRDSARHRVPPRTGPTTTNKVYPLQGADDRKKGRGIPEELLRYGASEGKV